ncbi:hypothetical protein MP228_012139 [Amoeboaphelidium protococcarum]|nr:hypothetical protein MP228_012139 [Amoeboaphelidium protococcarum]
MDQQYDVVINGTSLANSILSAALSKAGVKVLHIDQNGFYGALQGTVTADYLLKSQQQQKINSNIKNVSFEYVSCDTLKLEDLKSKLQKIYIDVVPSVLYAEGELIQNLVKTGFGEYLEFQLVKGHYYLPYDSLNADVNDVNIEDSLLLAVPQTKEDVFNNSTFSLVDKRRLMKAIDSLRYKIDQQQQQQLDTTQQQQEDVTIMRHQGDNDQNFCEYIDSFRLPVNFDVMLKDIVTCKLSSVDLSWQHYMTAFTKYVKSIGKYGKSPFLYPLYGISEISQAYCRVSAVHGSTFILGYQSLEVSNGQDNQTNVRIKFEGTNSGGDSNIYECQARYIVQELEQQRGDTAAMIVNRIVFVFSLSQEDQGLIKEQQFMQSVIVASVLPGQYVYIRVQDSTSECCPPGYVILNMFTICNDTSMPDLFQKCAEKLVTIISNGNLNLTDLTLLKILFSVENVPRNDFAFTLDDHVMLAEEKFNLIVAKLGVNRKFFQADESQSSKDNDNQ